MKTTLVIDDQIMKRIKQEAARQRRTMSELVEEALRAFLNPPRQARKLSPLPSYKCGEFLVDIANRDELDRALDGL